jgi:uncharacterized membrane protein
MSVAPLTQQAVHMGPPMAVAAYDIEGLAGLAKQADGLIVLPFAVGDTILEGESFITVLGGRRTVAEADLHTYVRLATERTFEQDLKYAFRLLVDIAIKALSPAVNDPTTAVQALDHIEDLLRRLSSRHLRVGQVWDEAGVLRVRFPTPTWADFLSLAFDEIRFYGATSVQVIRRLRAALYDLDRVVPAERRAAILEYIAHLNATVRRSITDEQDQQTALEQDRQGLGVSRPQKGTQ